MGILVQHDLGHPAGASALTTKVAGSGPGMMSIFSPWLADHRLDAAAAHMPTQAPTDDRAVVGDDGDLGPAAGSGPARISMMPS
jgi:hypothetical protein